MNINNPPNGKEFNSLEAKIDWIQINYLFLIQLLKAGDEYKKNWRPELGKFEDYLSCTCEELPEFFCEILKIIDSMGKNCETEPSPLDDRDLTDFIDELKRLSSPSYEGSDDLEEILKDLKFLWLYWEACRRYKTYFASSLAGVPEAGLDMALVKLSKNIGRWEFAAMFYASREVPRTKKGTKEKQDKNDKRKGFVIAIYEHGKPIEPGTKFNMACDMIQTQFDKSRGNDKAPWGLIPKDPNEMKTPSLDSIGRWLIEAGIRDRDFKKEGGFWIKQT